MKRDAENGKGCGELERIMLEESEERFDSGRQEFEQLHFSECEECRLEAAALAAIKFDGTSGPCMQLDDIRRRKYIEEILDAAGDMDARAFAEEFAEDVKRDENDKKMSGGARYWKTARWGAGIVVAAGVALFLFLRFVVYPVSVSEKSSVMTVDSSEVQVAEVALVSGDVESDKGRILPGELLERGRKVLVRRGRSVLHLPDGSVVLMEGRTEIQVKKPGIKRVRLGLLEGAIMVWAAPNESRESFVIETPYSEVAVKGTVFGVTVDSVEQEIAVHRGKVVLSAEKIPEPLEVGRGERAVLKDGRIEKHALESLQVDEFSRFGSLVYMLSSAKENGAGLRVETKPAGAQVIIDGTVMGETPVSASMNPGFRTMIISMQGYAPIKEGIQLRRDHVIEREYVLAGRKTARDRDEDIGEDVSEFDDSKQPARTKSHRAGRGQTIHPGRPPDVKEDSAEHSEVHPARRLLTDAQHASKERRFEAAVKSYKALVIRYPDRPEARPALVSMGRILLSPLSKPDEALKSFDRYLSITGRGALAQEASYGRIRALRALGRRGEEIKALKKFLKYFPGAIQEESIKKRLNTLSTVPKPSKEAEGEVD